MGDKSNGSRAEGRGRQRDWWCIKNNLHMVWWLNVATKSSLLKWQQTSTTDKHGVREGRQRDVGWNTHKVLEFYIQCPDIMNQNLEKILIRSDNGNTSRHAFYGTDVTGDLIHEWALEKSESRPRRDTSGLLTDNINHEMKALLKRENCFTIAATLVAF